MGTTRVEIEHLEQSHETRPVVCSNSIHKVNSR